MAPPRQSAILQQDPSPLPHLLCRRKSVSQESLRTGTRLEGDLQPFLDQREFLQPSSNVLYAFSFANGYANLTPNYLVDIWGDQNRAGIITQTASTQGDSFQPTPVFGS